MKLTNSEDNYIKEKAKELAKKKQFAKAKADNLAKSDVYLMQLIELHAKRTNGGKYDK